MKVGDINFKSNVFLAPLAGITDLSFRMRCLSYGAGLVVIPMINANAVVRGNNATYGLLKTIPEETPKSVQLFGSRVDVIKEAAKKVVEMTKCDMIDFNMGCPDRLIIGQGSGAALLKRPGKIKEIVSGLKSVVDVPVSIKIRIGGSEKSINAIKNAKIIEEAGADMLTVHGRTVAQGYSGKADWEMIKQVKESVSIPVVGNGDIWDYADVASMIEKSGVDAVMIGRGALGRPWIFSGERKDALYELEKYLDNVEKYGDFNFHRVKQHALYFTKGIEGSTEIRRKITQTSSVSDIRDIFSTIKK